MKLNWGKLTVFEPALQDLYSRVQEAVKGRELTHTQANHLWYGPPGGAGFKYEMNRLVGLMVKDSNPEIAGTDAHLVAYRKLYYETIDPAIIEEREN